MAILRSDVIFGIWCHGKQQPKRARVGGGDDPPPPSSCALSAAVCAIGMQGSVSRAPGLDWGRKRHAGCSVRFRSCGKRDAWAGATSRGSQKAHQRVRVPKSPRVGRALGDLLPCWICTSLDLLATQVSSSQRKQGYASIVAGERHLPDSLRNTKLPSMSSGRSSPLHTPRPASAGWRSLLFGALLVVCSRAFQTPVRVVPHAPSRPLSDPVQQRGDRDAAAGTLLLGRPGTNCYDTKRRAGRDDAVDEDEPFRTACGPSRT
jgi:hypothetical protein